jgi:predicted permease
MTVWSDGRSSLMLALRNLGRQPGFAATVVLVLGTAIGLNVTLFTIAAGIAWRPWGGVSRPSEIVRIYLVDATGPASGFSLADARALAAAATSFAGVSTMRSESVRVGREDAATTVRAELVSANFFDVLGVVPALGRRFTAAEDLRGDSAPVAILGHQFWQNRFGADRGVVGTLVPINGVPFTIVGITSPEFTDSEPGFDTQVFLPVNTLPLLRPGDRAAAAILDDPKSCCADVVARLRPGIDREQARAELAVRARSFASFSGLPARGVELAGTPFMAQPSRADSAEAMLLTLMLSGALILIWLIACANVGNLLLSRAVARLGEMSTRLALGATRGRLVRQLLGESLILALLAGAFGIGVAYQLPLILFRLVADPATSGRFPFSVAPDASVIAFTLLLGILSTAAFALAPALLVTRLALRTTLNQRPGQWPERLRVRGALLAVQVAVSVVLLVSAGLLIRSMQRQAATFEPGFAVDDIVAVSFALPEASYDRARATALFGEIAASLGSRQATEFAFASNNPFSRYMYGTLFHLPGESRAQARQLFYTNVSPEYLDVLEIPLVSGRRFESADTSRQSAVVNEAMARRYWPGESAVGKSFFMRPRGPVDQMVAQEVIGVARDVRATAFADAVPMFYRPYVAGADVLDFISSDPRASQPPVLLVKARNASLDTLAPVVARLDPRVRVMLQPLSTSLETMLASAKWGPILAATLGVFALGLATVGTFGVFAYAVQQRRREIGVRMALGAQSGAVVHLLLAGHARAVAIGLVMGLAGAAVASAGLRSRLHGLSAFDPIAYLGVGSVLLVCGLAATYLPARRATRISPLESLGP